MKEYFVYWHPGNDVPATVSNPLSIIITTEPSDASKEIKEILADTHPGMKDVIIFDGRLDPRAEYVVFEAFRKSPQSKDLN